MKIEKSLKGNKSALLSYFRDRAEEVLSEIKLTYGNTQFKEQASAINKAMIEDIINFFIYQVVLIRVFKNSDSALTICRLCSSYPINNVSLFVPPLFSEVKQKLATEIETYIDKLNITNEDKEQLKKYYHKVWGLVTSGEIKLELDLHFLLNNQKFVVDFKSGFGSNEKGNTNRLLLVASIYRNLEGNYKCMIFVRADDNNHYFQTLKNSGIWDAYSGAEAYNKMKEYSGFNIYGNDNRRKKISGILY